MATNLPGVMLTTNKSSAVDARLETDVADLVKENKALNQELRVIMKRVSLYLVFNQIIGIVKIILIVVPLILALVYLPFLKDLWTSYQNALK